MNFVRKALLVLITPIFSLLLFATATDMGVMRVVNQPNNIKQILAKNGVYDSAVNSLLDQAKQITNDNGSGNVPLSNPAIRSAANSAITPQYLQQNTESVIDSVYRWLNGKTPLPDFNIDLSSVKAQFASSVGKSVEQTAASLPTCTDAASASASAADLVSATCLPPGVTPAAAASEVEASILDGKGFLDHPVVNADSVKSSKSNQSVFADQLKDVPKQYQRIKKTPIILAATTLLLAVIMVFLNPTRRKGLRHVGVTVLAAGLFMLVFAWALNYAVSKKFVPNLTLNNAVLQKDARGLVTDISQKVDQNYWIFGGVYATLGGLALGAAMFWRGKGQDPKSKGSLKDQDNSPEDKIDLKEPDKTTPLVNSRPPAKSSAKRTIKVQ